MTQRSTALKNHRCPSEQQPVIFDPEDDRKVKVVKQQHSQRYQHQFLLARGPFEKAEENLFVMALLDLYSGIDLHTHLLYSQYQTQRLGPAQTSRQTRSSIENTNVHGWSRVLVTQVRRILQIALCTFQHHGQSSCCHSVFYPSAAMKAHRQNTHNSTRSCTIVPLCYRLLQVLCLTVAPVDWSGKGAL